MDQCDNGMPIFQGIETRLSTTRFLDIPDVLHRPSFASHMVNMASPPPLLETQMVPPTENTSVDGADMSSNAPESEVSQPLSLETQMAPPTENNFVDESDMSSNASESEESAPPPPNQRNQPKMTPRAIRKRRRRNDSRAFKKSLQGQYSSKTSLQTTPDLFSSPSLPPFHLFSQNTPMLFLKISPAPSIFNMPTSGSDWRTVS